MLSVLGQGRNFVVWERVKCSIFINLYIYKKRIKLQNKIAVFILGF